MITLADLGRAALAAAASQCPVSGDELEPSRRRVLAVAKDDDCDGPNNSSPRSHVLRLGAAAASDSESLPLLIQK